MTDSYSYNFHNFMLSDSKGAKLNVCLVIREFHKQVQMEQM